MYIRSGYFIDRLKTITGQGLLRLERRVRENQYERFGLVPPSIDTVRDYFRLHRNIALDPKIKRPSSPPWLLAAEREVPGASYDYFHPAFDLLWGRVCGGVFWRKEIQKIPKEWINDERTKGDEDTASEWERINKEVSRRRISARAPEPIDTLGFIHLSLMRISDTSPMLFDRNGFAGTRARRYRPIKKDIREISALRSFDSVAALLGLMLEGAEIGDRTRQSAFRDALLSQLSVIDELQECRRIGKKLKSYINNFIDQGIVPRCYGCASQSSLCWPDSWRFLEANRLLQKKTINVADGNLRFSQSPRNSPERP